MKKYTEKNPHPLGKEFPITSLSRADFIDAGYNKNLVMAITDDEMQYVARKIGDAIMDTFWIALEYQAEENLNLKKKR